MAGVIEPAVTQAAIRARPSRLDWASTLRIWRASNRIRLVDDLLRVFREGGLSVRLTHFGYHAVTMHVVGSTLRQLGYSTPAADMREAGPTFASSWMQIDVPFSPTATGGDLGFILDPILDGLERSRGRGQRKRSRHGDRA